MKKLLQISSLLLLISLFTTQISIAQVTKTIGTGTNYTNNYPTNGYYNYSYSYSIYDATEIGMGGIINKIEYYVGYTSPYTMNNQKVYLLNTSSSYFSNGNYENPTTLGATLVYNGSITWNNTGWHTLNLLTNFVYNGTDNLMVIWENRDGSFTSTYARFNYTSSSANKTKYSYNDSYFPTTGNTTTNRPNIRLTLLSLTSNDLAVQEISSPTNGSSANASMPFSIKVRNNGSTKQANYLVKYSIDNGTNWESKTISDSISPYTTNTVLFNQTGEMADMSTAGVYQCIGVVSNSGDTINENDTIRENITICNSAYSGDYTIGNDASSDFPDLQTAFEALELCGVSGPINLKFKSGTYNIQAQIPSINGISASAPLTIESFTGNANNVELTYYATNSNDNYIFRFDTTSFVSIRNLTFSPTNKNFSECINLYASNNISITNCKFNGKGLSYNNRIISLHSTNISNDNITINNNKFKNGTTAIYSYGGTHRNYRLNILNNEITNTFSTFIDIYNTDSVLIKNNTIKNESLTEPSNSKLFSLSNSKSIIITQNKLSNGTRTQIYLYNCNGSSSDPIKINNNFLYQSFANSNQPILNINNSNYIDIDFNSLHLKGNSSGVGINYQSGSYSNIRNNNIINETPGYAIKVSNPNSILSCDYNNYYTSGNYIARWQYTSCSDISALQTASSKDAHSISNNISYYSDDNLHVVSSVLDGKGVAITGITEDFDGETRDSIPDIGADEFTIYQNDIALMSFENLTNICPGSVQNISVKLSNMGSSGVSNISLTYSINGSIKDTVTWTGLLGLQNSVDKVLGSYTFDADSFYTIKAWINSVNLVTDSNRINDTVVLSDFHTSLAGGTYIIGSSSSADYSNITEAVEAMKEYGICGSVVFQIEDGTYNDQYIIQNIPGHNSANTISFEALNHNADNVILTYNSTNAYNAYIFYITSSGNISFKNLAFHNTGNGSQYFRSIHVNLSSNINIDSCSFIGIENSSYSNENILFYSYESGRISVTNSIFDASNSGIKCSNYSNSTKNDITISNNRISNFYGNGIYLQNIGDSINIIGNTLTDASVSASNAIYLDKCKGMANISNNNIFQRGTGLRIGIYITQFKYYTNYTSNLKIYNNFINLYAPDIYLNAANSGLKIEYSNNVDAYYNTIKLISKGTNSYAVYFYSLYSFHFKNNSIDAGDSKVMNQRSCNSSIFDHNNYYSTDTIPILYNNNFYSLTDYKTTSSKDNHSISVSPYYLGTNDLHLHDINLNNAGTPISGITTDIDGEARSTNAPDIGADEFVMLANDAELYAINNPIALVAQGNMPIKVSLRNYGTSNLVSDSIHYQIDNNAIGSYYWSGSIAPLGVENYILIGNESITAGNHSVKIWSTHPNNTTDLHKENDTLSYDFVVQNMPSISFNPDILSATIPSCDDSAIVSLQVINTGGQTLHYNIDSLISNGFDSTSIKNFTYNNKTTTHKFINTGEYADSLVITLTINGDFGNSYKWCDIFVEGTHIGTFQGGSYGVDLTTTFTLSGAQLNTYLKDNKITINVTNSYNVTNYSGTRMHKVQIQTYKSNFINYYGNASDSVSPGDTALLNYTFKSFGLLNSTYTDKIKFISDDLGKPISYLPYSLTVDGEPIIVTSTNNLSFDTTYNAYEVFDTLEVYNTGCGDLYITNITNSNTKFTALNTTDTCTPGDTAFIAYKFLSSTAGNYTATSLIYNNDTNYTINLTAVAITPPLASLSPNPLSVTIQNCNDSSTVNISVTNIGDGTLDADFKITNDTVEILMLTYGTYSSYNTNIINSFDETFEKYRYSSLNNLNATTVQNHIDDHKVDVIILPYSYSASYYFSIKNVLKDFANEGGTIILSSPDQNLLNAIDLLSTTYNGNESYENLTTINPNDSLTANFPTSTYFGGDYFNYYTNNDDDNTISLMTYTDYSNNTYDVVFKKSYGYGNIIVIGLKYNSSYSTIYTTELMSNSIKSAFENGAPWIDFTETSLSLDSGATGTKSIEFNSLGMEAGTYTAQIRLNTNNPTNPVVYLPCTLTVQNEMANPVDLGSDTTTCGALTLNAGTYPNYQWSNGDTTQAISAMSSGTYSVTVSSGICTSRDTMTIVVNPLPSVLFTGVPASICTNEAPITLTASPTGGVFGGTGVSNGIFNPILAGAGTHNIVYSYTNSYNCTNMATQPIIVNNIPLVTFTGLASSYCPSGTASILTGMPQGGTFNGNGITSNIFSPDIAGVGTHNIVYSFTDANNCTNSDTNSTVVLGATVNIVFSSYKPDYCINDAADTIIVTPVGGNISGDGMLGNVFNPSNAGLGIHYIKYTKLDPNSCIIYDSVKVEVHALPTGLSIASLNQNYCAYDTSITLTGLPSGGIFNGSGVVSNTFNPSLSGAGVSIINYIYTDTFGCASTVSTSTTVNALPIINFVNTQNQYCVDDIPVTVFVSPLGGILSGTGVVSSQFFPTISGAGSHYVYYEYTDANTCYNKDSFNFVVNALPLVSINAINADYCSNDQAVSLSGTPLGGIYSGDGVSNGSFNPSQSGGGIKNIFYSYSDYNGCSNTDTISTNVNIVQGVNTGSDKTVAYNNSTQLTAVITGGTGSFDYEWTPSTSVNNPNSLSTSTTNLTISTMFSLAVTDNSTSCINSDEILVTVTGGPLNSSSSANPTTICAGETTQLQAIGSGGNGNYTYSWTSVPVGFNSSIFNPIADPNITTTYTCIIGDGTDTVQQHIVINVNPTPNASILNLNSTYCNTDNSVNIIVSPPGGTLSGTGVSGFYFNPSNANTGQNFIVYSITNTNGCFDSDTAIVNVGITPSAYAGADTTLPCLNSGINIGQAPVTGVNYQWSPSIGLNSTTIANPISNPNLAIDYTLVATDNVSGCNATDMIHIDVTGAPDASVSNDTLVCAGSTVTLNASGGDTYFWNVGATGSTITVNPSVSTLYYVIVSQAGCADMDTVWVNISQPMPNLGADTTTCGGNTINLDAGAGFNSYLWSNGAVTQTISIDSTGIGYNATLVYVAVTDDLSCNGSDSINIVFQNCTGLNNVDNNLFTVAVYPNPTKGKFIIESNYSKINEIEMNITDAQGRLILHKTLSNTNGIFKETIDFSNESKGLYFIKLSNNGVNKVFKIVVQ